MYLLQEMDRKNSLGQPRIVSTKENMDLIEVLVWLQEDQPHTHLAPRKIAEQTGTSRSSLQFKCLKTPQISE